MIRELKDSYNYTKVMLLLSVLTFIFGIAFSLIGEFFLPFAAAFYAALILFEKPRGRFLSYIIPSINLLIALLCNGFYALITFEYIILAVIMVMIYIHFGSKAECSVYMTLITGFFILISLYLGAARAIGDFSFSAVTDYYSDAYSVFKDKTIESFTSYFLSLENENNELVFSEASLRHYFDLLSKMIVSLIGILSFMITGISLKIFTALTLRYSKNGILKTFAHFLPSNLVAYIYMAIVLIYLLSDSSSIFSIAISNTYEILMCVFAYVGARFVYILGKINQRKSINFILIAALLFMTGTALQLLSYLGIWVTINTNKNIQFLPKK